MSLLVRKPYQIHSQLEMPRLPIISGRHTRARSKSPQNKRLRNKTSGRVDDNWRHSKQSVDPFAEWAPKVIVKRSILCGRGNVHVEYFSLHSQNLEVGARVFWGFEDAAEFVVNTGFAAKY